MKFLSIAIPLFFLITQSYAIEIPRLSSPVIDQAKLLKSRQKSKLETLLYSIKKNNGPQIQILTVKSLKGESIENFAIEVVDKWQLGNKQRDDGVLLLVSTGDRKMRIEVGDGLEGSLTDYKSGKIIRGMTKYFKSEQYDQGILFGATEIMRVIGVDASSIKVKRYKRSRSKKSSPLETLFTIIFIIFALFSRTRRSAFLFGAGAGGFSSRGSSFGGGGSSWGGGGGGFSGGGSSGSW
jgi:uncharacterized protein